MVDEPDIPILRVRKLQGRSQRSVAYQTGLDQSQLSKVERRKAPLSIDVLYRIAVVLGMRGEAAILRPYVWDRGLLDHSTWLREDDDPYAEESES